MEQIKYNFSRKINKILNNKEEKELLIDKYFKIQKEAEVIYGNNTAILIEIGSFYEIYEADNTGKAQEISKDLNIILTKKDKKKEEVNKSNPYMCGIPSITIEKYIDKLIDLNKWTIILIKQIKNIKNNKVEVSRYVEDIISNGVNVNFNKSYDYNFVSSLKIEKIKNVLYASISLIDVSIGEVYTYENFGDEEDRKIVIDEIYEILNRYKSKEIIISKSDNISQEEFEDIKVELELDKLNYIINSNKKEFKLEYKNEILKEAFKINSNLSPIEYIDLEFMPLSVDTLTALLTFITEHNPLLIENLKFPKIIKPKNNLYCGNNAIKQLNIIEDTEENSIEKIINKAKTAMGKRYVKNLLLSPITDKEKILKRYESSLKFNSIKEEKKKKIISEMTSIYDIERVFRLININKLKTIDFYNFVKSIESYENILLNTKEVLEDVEIKLNKIKKLLIDIKNNFIIENLKEYFFNNNTTYINIKNKEYIELKRTVEQLSILKEKIEEEKIIFLEKIGEKNNEEFVKLKYTEKEGYYIEISKTKFKTIKEIEGYEKRKFTSYIKITSEKIKEISDNILLLKNKKEILQSEIFKSYIEKFKNNDKIIDFIVNDIKNIDFNIVNDLLLKKKYTVPKIIDAKGKEKFIEAIEIRHPIVEEEENNGVYIPNDIVIGDLNNIKNKKVIEKYEIKSKKLNGIMLHGLNASGKSTLIKSIGVSIILAQSGFFVPAKEFRFSLFDSLFTRISGQDNIYKGLSTFTIEMLEMKNIFNRQYGNTLVLGDELSSGTETQSAISIVAGGFLTMQKLDNLFFFATHLHQLNELKEISGNKNLISLHLHVEYNKTKDNFVFYRKLKVGQGLSTYGLEYARFLNLNSDFIKEAYKIRNKIAKDKKDIEVLIKETESNYNKKIYMKTCIFCNEEATETHHIKHQKEANEEGYIEHFHKDNKNNLLPICKKHHKTIHNSNLCKLNNDKNKLMEWVSTSSGKKLWVSPYLVEEMELDIDSKKDLISY